MDEFRIEIYASTNGLFDAWDANVFRGRGESCRWIGSAGTALHADDVYAEAMRLVADARAQQELDNH